MDRYPYRPVFRTKLYVVCVSLAILVIFGLQFFWFSNSASSAIDSSYRTISETIHQTVSRQYHRYDVLLSLISVAQRKGFTSERSIRTFLEPLVAEYGTANGGARLIVYAAYVPSKGSAATTPFVTNEKYEWRQRSLSAFDSIPGEMLERLKSGGEIIHVAEGIGDEDVLLFESSGSSGKTPYLIGLGLNVDDFFYTYVEPAVASALAEYTIIWRDSPLPEPSEWDDPNSPAASRKYRFNPLRGLLRTDRQGEADSGLAVYIPRIPIVDMEWNGDLSNPPYQDNPVRVGGFRSILVHSQARRKKPPETFRKATVRLPNSSLEQAIEQRHSYSWLGGTALLIGIGFSFSFVILQRDKLVKLRLQERQFVASVTHELRTPLTVILSAAENLKKGIVPEEKLTQYAELILEQSRRLGRMIEETLSFSRMESGVSRSPERNEVETPELTQVLREYMMPLAAQAGIPLEWRFEALPPSLLCDSKSLVLILSNLIANAVHHAYPGDEKGEIRVSGWISPLGELSFSVEDDGRGISPKETKRIFEPFYRDVFSRNNQEKGSGLGLYLAKKTADFLGGYIRLESPYRREDGCIKPGCRFTLELPHTSEVEHDS